LGVLLADARMCAFPGRDGAPRSLGSVYGCFVTLFLGGSIRGVLKPLLGPADTGPDPYAHGLTASCRGAPLLKTNVFGPDATFLGCPPNGWLAPDGSIFIPVMLADTVQEFSPALQHRGQYVMRLPSSVCADDSHVVVAGVKRRVCVFRREDRALVHSFDVHPAATGMLKAAFLADHRFIALASCYSASCVLVYSIGGDCVRTFGQELRCINNLACSGADEVFVATKAGIAVFTATGVLLHTIASVYGGYGRVTVHGSRVFVLTEQRSFSGARGYFAFHSYRELV
jgi:hypothetical protein